jgi:cell division protein ZapA
MTDVTLTVGDRRYTVACREGEQGQLLRLGEMLDKHWAGAARVSGGLSGERTLLFVALMLADSLDEAERRTPKGIDGAVLDQLADRLERLAATLEKMPESA